MWEKLEKRKKELAGKCGLCDELAERNLRGHGWMLVENYYGYDAVAEKHDLLVHAEHGEKDMAFLDFIFKRFTNYDCIMVNYPDAQSVPNHAHIHLIKWKRD